MTKIMMILIAIIIVLVTVLVVIIMTVPEGLRLPLTVDFVGEHGIDAGGLRRALRGCRA